MASDQEYMDFLNKANEEPAAAQSSQQGHKSKKELKAADHGAAIPQPLVAATKEAFYVSDADEPFVPVSLAWEKGAGLPDEGMCTLYLFSAVVTTQGVSRFLECVLADVL